MEPSLDRHGIPRQDHAVIMPLSVSRCKAASWLVLIFCLLRLNARAHWDDQPTSLAWVVGTNVLWRFSYDTNKGKPFFHPVSVGGGPALTNFKPEDHPWHYGLWFSWKYINGANYWEEDRATGKAEGTTRWSTPKIETRMDGSARIRLDLTYTGTSNRIDLTENRLLFVLPPGSDGSFTIHWFSRFVAGKDGAFLDRWAMPGEPGGRTNGGYAGLSLRMAGSPLTISFVSSTGLVTRFESDRARPAASAVACNFMDGSRNAGSIAIMSHWWDGEKDAPWYLINSDTMHFVCAAILAPKPRQLKPDETLYLFYTIAVQRKPWTPESLKTDQLGWTEFLRDSDPRRAFEDSPPQPVRPRM
jgi:hypothetical protein